MVVKTQHQAAITSWRCFARDGTISTEAPSGQLADLADDIAPLPFENQRNALYRELSSLLFTGLTVTFLRQFCVGLWLTLPLLLSLALVITLLGQAVGKQEGWSRFDSLYWAFITATTVGYGDVRPVKRKSKIVAVVIAFLGLMLTGIVIAVEVQAATLALGNNRG